MCWLHGCIPLFMSEWMRSRASSFWDPLVPENTCYCFTLRYMHVLRTLCWIARWLDSTECSIDAWLLYVTTPKRATSLLEHHCLSRLLIDDGTSLLDFVCFAFYTTPPHSNNKKHSEWWWCIIFFFWFDQEVVKNPLPHFSSPQSMVYVRLLLLLLFGYVFSGQGQQQGTDYLDNNDMLLNAIHSNETPVINKAIAELR